MAKKKATKKKTTQKKYRFMKLSAAAKKVAVKQYLKGWEETHEKGDMSYDDAYSSCIDTNLEIFFTEKGKEIQYEEDY